MDGIVRGLGELLELVWSHALTLALVAALVAFATTPIAFAVLGRLQWFQARRGRTLQRPSFASVVVGMVLVMGIPAIFAALAIKSRHYDEDRYEFDPNRTISVLDQGRGYRSLREADEAVRAERKRLDEERKALFNGIKALDESLMSLRASAGRSPDVARALPGVLERLAVIRRAVGLDAPQQLQDETAPPAEIAAALGSAPPAVVATNVPAPIAPTPTGAGLSPAEVQAELSGVPEPQRALAAMLPLADLPAGWVVGKSGERHLETFNADNLFEKIDGRAESFLQYGVRGMAYTYYHPEGDESSEAQLYIFEMADPLNALGKYTSERPDEAQAVPVGDEAYTSAGSTLFYSGRYYTQVVTTSEDPKVAAFALEIARRVAARQSPGSGSVASAAPEAATTGAGSVSGPATTEAEATPEPRAVTPAALFKMLPEGPGQSGATFVAQDVFGYSFLAGVFMANYEDGDLTWQGFLRPYASPEEAREVFDQYVETAEQDGAELKAIEDADADRMVVSSNIGLVDAIFLKGNVIGGANGATDAAKAEAFARSFAESLPGEVPAIGGGKIPATEGTEGEGR